MLSVDGTGSVQIYDGNPEDKHRIVGAVSIHPTLVGRREYYHQKLDSKTLQPLTDEDGNSILKSDIPHSTKVTVGIVGRVPIHKKYLKYNLPKRWIVLPSAPELSDYEDFVLALIR